MVKTFPRHRVHGCAVTKIAHAKSTYHSLLEILMKINLSLEIWSSNTKMQGVSDKKKPSVPKS